MSDEHHQNVGGEEFPTAKLPEEKKPKPRPSVIARLRKWLRRSTPKVESPKPVLPQAEAPKAGESPQERKYRIALEAIAYGRPLEVLIAESALEKKKPNFLVRWLKGVGKNLATITGLVVAASGIVFGMFQYWESQEQRKASAFQQTRELKVKKVEALNDLIPSLTAESPDTRRYATAVLLSLYAGADADELRMLDDNLSQVANAETLEVLGVLRNNGAYKKRAAELFATRAEHERREMQEADNKKDHDKARTYLNASRADAGRALALDPDNAKALHQRAILRYEHESGSADEALAEFSKVITLIDEHKYGMDKEVYVRAHVRKAVVLFERDKKVSPAVCEAFWEAEKKFAEVCWRMDPNDPQILTFKKWCRKRPIPTVSTPCPTFQ